MSQLSIVLAVGLVPLVLFLGVAIVSYFRLWLRALLNGLYVPFAALPTMRLRGIDPSIFVNSRILAAKAGIAVSAAEIEEHCLAGGNALRVVQALILADELRFPLTFQQAATIELAGHDVLEVVRTSAGTGTDMHIEQTV